MRLGRMTWLTGLLVAAGLWLFPTPVLQAQPSEAPATQAPAAPAASSDEAGRGATTFRPSDASEEKTSGYALMTAAYLVMWLLVGLYALSLWRRQKRVGHELAGLRARLDKLDASVGGGGGASGEKP